MTTIHAQNRAEMPQGTNRVLDRRTVQNANRNLLELIKPGMKVLDVGCGSGTITSGIAALVGPEGMVMGIDASNYLIGQAKMTYAHVPNLYFEEVDLFAFEPEQSFDIITAARVLQWLSNPKEALEKMIQWLTPGGVLTILDYNHEKIYFEPAIPASMKVFYDRFLDWRKDVGFDNQIADHLEDMYQSLGLKNVVVTPHHEVSVKGQEEWMEEISLWKKVAESRGKQLVADKYSTDAERLQAIEDYQYWMENEAIRMELYLQAVTATR